MQNTVCKAKEYETTPACIHHDYNAVIPLFVDMEAGQPPLMSVANCPFCNAGRGRPGSNHQHIDQYICQQLKTPRYEPLFAKTVVLPLLLAIAVVLLIQWWTS